ncbi:hypothetical protein [Janthinobacterium sp. HLX7-2]|uniref:hypothetical protein n=1 Tax=Janthinobacterium sp. HLX7-2 TaxID=1259331 RepID=UPI003F20773A
MAIASPSPFQHAVAAGATATPAFGAPCFVPSPAPCHSPSHDDGAAGLPGDSCDAEECDNDPITLYPGSRQRVPFYAIIWQAGPDALAEADVRLATRPPRVRH